ncbi:MAG: WYL domain-containing protein [Bacteroidales bacterium]|nr:WYL domain-containing protein [Bacteroidales bacterium]
MMNNIIQEYLHKAITNGDTITIKYIKPNGESSIRQISEICYSYEFGGDNEYIEAFCHTRNERRTFKISRIIDIEDINKKESISQVKKKKTAYTGNML